MSTDLPVVTTGGFARALGISTPTLKKWVQAGLLPEAFVTPGGHRRWRPSQVDAFLASHTR